MKNMVVLIILLFVSIGEARVIFSSATPLSPRLQERVRQKVENRCNIQSFSVVESRTLVTNDESAMIYFSTFAVLDLGGSLVSNIEVQSRKQGNSELVQAVRGPLCH